MKTEVPTDTPTEFELGDTAAHVQRIRGEGEQGEREEGDNRAGRRIRRKPEGWKRHKRKLHRWRKQWPKKTKH